MCMVQVKASGIAKRACVEARPRARRTVRRQRCPAQNRLSTEPSSSTMESHGVLLNISSRLWLAPSRSSPISCTRRAPPSISCVTVRESAASALPRLPSSSSCASSPSWCPRARGRESRTARRWRQRRRERARQLTWCAHTRARVVGSPSDAAARVRHGAHLRKSLEWQVDTPQHIL